MGFLKDIIERRESFGKMEKGSGESVIWTTNPRLTDYLKVSRVDNQDLAHIVTKTVNYFRRSLGLSLSTIEKFHVKKITEDTIQRFKNVFLGFPEGTITLHGDEFKRCVWSYLANGSLILPDKMWVEVSQRILLEVYSTPFEIERIAGSEVPRYEIDYLARIQHRQNNAFIGEDYQK